MSEWAWVVGVASPGWGGVQLLVVCGVAMHASIRELLACALPPHPENQSCSQHPWQAILVGACSSNTGCTRHIPLRAS